MKVSGIYSITNTINNKSYIGSSVDISNRWRSHKHSLLLNKHKNKHLQNAWNKYGESFFIFEILETVPRERLMDVEQRYLDSIKLTPERYYNLTYSVEGGMVNKRHTNKAKELIRQKANESYCNGQRETMKQAWVKRKAKGLIQSHVDSSIYSFRNRVTNEVFTGRQVDFYKQYNLCNTKVCCLVKGTREHHKDWILN